MRTHGWARNPPASDVEARQRIIDATMRCVGRYGQAKTSLSDVATEVGVTRTTIYRYFPSTEALLAEAGLAAADEFLTRLIDGLAGISDPVETLVEAMARAIEELPKSHYAGILLAPGRPRTFANDLMSSGAHAAAGGVLDRLGFDWDRLLDGAVSREHLIEMQLRLVHSFVLEPGDPPYAGERLRGFLRSWIRSAIAR